MEIKCPLIDNRIIADIDCLENSDIADGIIKDAALPDEYKAKDNWREICKKCKNHRE